ncbi:MAG: PRC-barrel domain-containing protein [Bacteroidota bacterium]
MNNRVLSSSSLQNNPVFNNSGERLGEIKDLVIDTESGRVLYSVLSFGGLFGFGDKLFAIPLQAMHLDTENERFVFNIDKSRLENAPGFDKDNWPLTPDNEWIDSVYSYYSIPSVYSEAVY